MFLALAAVSGLERSPRAALVLACARSRDHALLLPDLAVQRLQAPSLFKDTARMKVPMIPEQGGLWWRCGEDYAVRND